MRMLVVDRAVGYRVVTLAGELDLETAPGVRAALVEVVRQADRVDVDLARVSSIDCAGINALVAARRAATVKGCAFVVVNPSPRTRRLLSIAGPAGCALRSSRRGWGPVGPTRRDVAAAGATRPPAASPCDRCGYGLQRASRRRALRPPPR